MAKTVKKGQRDEKGRYVSPVNGQPVPDSPAARATRFRAGDPRAKEAQRKSTESKRERGDLRRLCQIWLEEEIATGKDGEKITGAQMMIRVAAKEISKGNPRFWEMIRDTAGFKPVDRVMVADVDPGVIADVEQMVKDSETE